MRKIEYQEYFCPEINQKIKWKLEYNHHTSGQKFLVKYHGCDHDKDCGFVINHSIEERCPIFPQIPKIK